MKTLKEIISEEKRRAIIERLEHFNGNKTAAAASLGMHYMNLWKLVRDMDIKVEKVVTKKEPVVRELKQRRGRVIPPREELLSLDKLEDGPRRYEITKATQENHMKKYLEKLEGQRLKRIENRKAKLHWEDDPDFDTGYEQPTPEERDEWYNRDRF